MPPALFSLTHLILLVLLGLAAWCSLEGCRKSRRPIFRFAFAVAAGATAGVILAYAGAHAALLLMKGFGAVTGDAGYAFIGLFIGMAMIGVIAGGLLGILLLRRKDQSDSEESCENAEKESPPAGKEQADSGLMKMPVKNESPSPVKKEGGTKDEGAGQATEKSIGIDEFDNQAN